MSPAEFAANINAERAAARKAKTAELRAEAKASGAVDGCAGCAALQGRGEACLVHTDRLIEAFVY